MFRIAPLLLLAVSSAAFAADQSATTTTTTTTAAAPAPAEKMICRRQVEIGSLVKGTRRCATASEWRRSAQAARDTTQNIQDQKGVYNPTSGD